MGVSLGGIIITPLATYLVDELGWRAAWIWLGVLSFLLMVPVTWAMRSRPEDYGLYPDGLSADAYKSDRDIVDYFVSNFSYGHDATLYSRITSESYYTDWNRVRQSMHNTFKSDLATILLHLEKERLTEKDLYNFNVPNCFIGSEKRSNT